MRIHSISRRWATSGPLALAIMVIATMDVVLSAGGASFDTWTAHPEVSACER